MIRKSWLPIVGLLMAPLSLRGQATSPQKEPLKTRPVVVRMRPACATPIAQASSPTDDQRRDARDLAQRARQSAILGDAAAALDQLKGAAALDPTDPTLAYELARAYESANSISSAASEYCRFLSLAPNAAEAADVRTHVNAMVPPKSDTVVTAEGSAFNRGADAYDKGQLTESEAFFGSVIGMDSTASDAFYNRAVIRVQQDRPDDAADDFERYLRIRPEAPDRLIVVARINSLRTARLSASEAFGLGIVLPGGGQFYTRRPIRGMLSLIAVGASAGLAVMPKTTTTTATQTASDPFGNTYTYNVTTQHKSRPYFIAGLGAAGGIALLSAIDASLYAHNVRRETISVSLAPSPGGVGVYASIRMF